MRFIYPSEWLKIYQENSITLLRKIEFFWYILWFLCFFFTFLKISSRALTEMFIIRHRIREIYTWLTPFGFDASSSYYNAEIRPPFFDESLHEPYRFWNPKTNFFKNSQSLSERFVMCTYQLVFFNKNFEIINNKSNYDWCTSERTNIWIINKINFTRLKLSIIS